MDRRTFLQISAVGTVAISLPLAQCKTRNNELLEFPRTLSSFCDEKTIREVGSAYLQKHPGENKTTTLKGLLLQGYTGKGMEDADAISALLENKIHTDFENAHTEVLKGWVLSVTEARQCALYSLSKV